MEKHHILHQNMYIFIYFLISSFYAVYSQTNEFNYEGLSCVEKYDGQKGECVKYKDCVSVKALYQNQGVKPTICGYTQRHTIVCCPYSNTFKKPSTSVKEDDITVDDKFYNNPITISERKCAEYSSRVSQTISTLVFTAQPTTITRNVPQCKYSPNPLIVGGVDAKVGEFPHMAAIGWINAKDEFDWSCGGSLISESFVLTAGHCIYKRDAPNPSPVMVRLGAHNLRSETDLGTPKDIEIAEIIAHPNYSTLVRYNDIALLRLRTKARFDSYIRPACLWHGPIKDNEKVIATGWGVTKSDGNEHTGALQKVGVKIISNDRCRSLSNEESRRLPNGIINTQLCAAELSGGKDTCQGDSGGPLQLIKKHPCIFFITGVTSFGKRCAVANTPGIYTKVSEYIPWIESVVWPNN